MFHDRYPADVQSAESTSGYNDSDLVGDTDQLPSVGAGNVLKDMIASGQIPVVKLERFSVRRREAGSL